MLILWQFRESSWSIGCHMTYYVTENINVKIQKYSRFYCFGDSFIGKNNLINKYKE